MTPKLGNNDFIPLIFAADINVYSMARAFHEQYGIVSAAYGKASTGPIRNTRILDYQARPHADMPDVLAGLVREFAQAHSDRRILVLGCGDNYVRRISIAKNLFPDNVIVPYLDFEELNRLANKQSFYQLCDRYGIVHPATFVYEETFGGNIELDFEAPYIVKPANSVSWWEHSFEGQKKVHLVEDRQALKTLISTIYAHGYDDAMIIQEYIPGEDHQLYVLTQYFDSASVLRLSCAGRVLLEEHTPYGIGNSAIILSEPQPQLSEQLADLLKSQNYRGFACFDIKKDPRDGQFKVFEVNTRQGRGNYYVTGSGLNLARHITEDLVYGRELVAQLEPQQQFLWHVTPQSVVRQCAAEAGLSELVDELMRSGRSANPLDYPGDRSIQRLIWLARYTSQQGQKYESYKRGE